MTHSVGQDEFMEDEVGRFLIGVLEELLDLRESPAVQDGFVCQRGVLIRTPAGVFVLGIAGSGRLQGLLVTKVSMFEDGMGGASAEGRMDGCADLIGASDSAESFIEGLDVATGIVFGPNLFALG